MGRGGTRYDELDHRYSFRSELFNLWSYYTLVEIAEVVLSTLSSEGAFEHATSIPDTRSLCVGQ
jgi:hypothetical protein